MADLMNKPIEGILAKYLEFRIFELFKNRMIGLIKPHCRENSKEDLYQHLFLCPSQLSKTRNFQLHGVLSPFVCLWRTSGLEWNKTLYGRSVLNTALKKDFSMMLNLQWNFSHQVIIEHSEIE